MVKGCFERVVIEFTTVQVGLRNAGKEWNRPRKIDLLNRCGGVIAGARKSRYALERVVDESGCGTRAICAYPATLRITCCLCSRAYVVNVVGIGQVVDAVTSVRKLEGIP